MALHYLFVFFFGIAFLVALIRLIAYFFKDQLNAVGFSISDADLNIFNDMVESTFEMSKVSVNIAIYLIGIMTLWLGIMKIGEKGGAVNIMSRAIQPFFKRIFPEVPKDHPAFGAMMMNFAANMLGLDNAATPMGLKAMKELQAINKREDTASNAQIMFLVLNTSGLTLIPISVMALRAEANAANPTDVFIPILLATLCATLTGLVVTALVQRINLFQPIVLAYLAGIVAFVVGIIAWANGFEDRELMGKITGTAGNFILFSVIVWFIYLGWKSKINVYSTFIEGAKEGFSTAITIIPYLVGMLVAIGVFRASGTLDMLISGIGAGFEFMGFNTDFIDALPTAFMKPLSGSGARSMMVETMKNNGADSFSGYLSSIFQGSTETTFYTLAVYFGAVNIKNTRNAAKLGIIADLAGILAAILIAYIFFPY